MKTIWKFPFRVNDRFTLDMPGGAKVLSLQMQGNQPTMWALVDPTTAVAKRDFRLFGTGHEITGDLGEFVGTFQYATLVFHVFEAGGRVE